MTLQDESLSRGFEREVRSGDRFRFGRNWRRFLAVLDPRRIAEAETALTQSLGLDRLEGKRFLDIGSGSGLSSLAARRLGAVVHSFDYDSESVACAEELKSRYCPNDSSWRIERGSILDEDYLSSIGRFDVVYSWGVLHHSGDMWTALANAAALVDEGGALCVAIYNDDGVRTRAWRRVKKTYNSGLIGRVLVCTIFLPYFALRDLAGNLIVRKNPFASGRPRGMSALHDWVDWLGGYPYETATPEALFHFYRGRGFELVNLRTTNRHGTNELVFSKRAI